MSGIKSTSTKNSATSNPATAARGKRNKPAVPWVDGGIDYGPALVAIDDLMSWAFDLADASVADWPQARRRVKNARRFVHGMIAGKRVRKVPEADVAFAASLLVRIFDADLELGASDIIAVLSELGLPTCDVPEPRRPVTRPMQTPAAPTMQEVATFISALDRAGVLAPVMPLHRVARVSPVRASPCEGCPAGHRVAA